LAASNPQLSAFTQEVATAQARTAELGTAYPKVSQALYNAVQSCLAGGASPQSALDQAQRDATS
jgi:multiple sugar transport system substrate-binding protein